MRYPIEALTRSAEARSPPLAAPAFRPAPSQCRNFERGGDLPKRLRPGGLGLANGRRDAVGECVGAGRVVRVGYRAGLGELGIAEGLSAGLGGGQGGNRALADHLAARARREPRAAAA